MLDERTGGTSSARASGNPPVVSSPVFKSNSGFLDELRLKGYADIGTPEPAYILEHVSYQHLIPYFKALAYLPPSEPKTVNAAHNLLTFDRRMQSVLMQYVGIFEAQFRAQYLARMTEAHGPFAVYDPGNFLREEKRRVSSETYETEVLKRSRRDRAVRQMYEEWGSWVPLWVGMECMTLGTLSAFYSNTADRSVTDAVASSFGCRKDELVSWTKTITAVRNICAHFEPLFVRKQLPSQPKRIFGVSCSRRTPLYAVLILVKLLEDVHFQSYDSNLIYARNLELSICAHLEDLQRVYPERMPLPSIPFNWRTLLNHPELRKK